MAEQLSPEIEMGEVKLKVSSLERSLQFYQDVIGFRILKQDGTHAELTADGDKVLLVLEEMADAEIVPAGRFSGLYHFALLLPSRADLGVALRRLIDKEIHVDQADHAVSEALYISDPDQNGIEIYRDRPREDWRYDDKGNVIMTSERIDWEGLLREAKGKDWVGLPTGSTMGHVHLHVSDLDKSKRFYCDILGFDVTFDGWRQLGALFISAGGYHHHLGLNIWAGAGAPRPPQTGTGLAYFTIIAPNYTELEKIVVKLRDAGISAVEQGGTWRVQDPSGIEILLKAA